MMSILGGSAQARFEVSADHQVGECRRAAQRLAQGCGFDEAAVGRVGIVASELATNLVRHARDGELLLQVLEDEGGPQIELLAIDRGPGMADVQRCLQDGYSTAGTLGTGLGAVTRLSSSFDIYSVSGQGTVVLARLRAQRPQARHGAQAPAADRGFAASALEPGARVGAAPGGSALEYGAVCVPMPGEIECGDRWQLASDGRDASLLIVDGLGHGPFAAVAARAAAEAFVAEPLAPPVETMQRMHRAMNGTRGAAAACARLEADAERLDYAGIGNIAGSMVSPQRSQGMVSHNGTLGTLLLRVQQFSYPWSREAHLIMHSDGISARWSLAAYEGLQARHSAVIAAVLYRDHRRGRDDATVLVARRCAPDAHP